MVRLGTGVPSVGKDGRPLASYTPVHVAVRPHRETSPLPTFRSSNPFQKVLDDSSYIYSEDYCCPNQVLKSSVS